MASFNIVICVSEMRLIQRHMQWLRHCSIYIPGAVLEFLNTGFLRNGPFRKSTINIVSIEVLAGLSHGGHLIGGGLEAISSFVNDWERHQVFPIGHGVVEGIHFTLTTDDYLNINLSQRLSLPRNAKLWSRDPPVLVCVVGNYSGPYTLTKCFSNDCLSPLDRRVFFYSYPE